MYECLYTYEYKLYTMISLNVASAKYNALLSLERHLFIVSSENLLGCFFGFRNKIWRGEIRVYSDYTTSAFGCFAVYLL